MRVVLSYLLCGAFIALCFGVRTVTRSQNLVAQRNQFDGNGTFNFATNIKNQMDDSVNFTGQAKIIMFGEGCSGGESLKTYFHHNGLHGQFHHWSDLKKIRDSIQQDIDANDCNLPSLERFTSNFLGDWKPGEHLDFVSSGWADNQRAGISKLINCM